VSSATSASRPGPYGAGGLPVARGVPEPAPRQRGLAPAAAVLLALGVSLLGAGVDLVAGRTLGLGFGVCLAVGCLLAACAVQRRGLKTVLFAPPLLYAAVALGVGLLTGSVPRTVTRQVIELVTVLILGAPALLAAVALVALVVLLRAARR